MAIVFVYVTAGSREEAHRIGRAMVEERLAACANIIGGMSSIYRWHDAVEEATETVLILKTREELVDPLTARVRALHSYEVPCVVALPITGGNNAYLDWIAEETSR